MKAKILGTVLKHIPHIVLGILLAIAGVFAYTNYTERQEVQRRYEDLLGKTSDYEQITEELAQLETKYADQKKLNEKAAKEWAEKEAVFKDRIKALADATFEGGTDTQEGEAKDLMALSFGTHFCAVLQSFRKQSKARCSLWSYPVLVDTMNRDIKQPFSRTPLANCNLKTNVA